jgi:hypothetical protein
MQRFGAGMLEFVWKRLLETFKLCLGSLEKFRSPVHVRVH